jgi:hypothetical protein
LYVITINEFFIKKKRRGEGVGRKDKLSTDNIPPDPGHFTNFSSLTFHISSILASQLDWSQYGGPKKA